MPSVRVYTRERFRVEIFDDRDQKQRAYFTSAVYDGSKLIAQFRDPAHARAFLRLVSKQAERSEKAFGESYEPR